MTDDLPTDPNHDNDPLVPERARIEASPPDKKTDALPILYLVGFLILAGSLIYLWRHPTLPSGAVQQAASVNALQQEADARKQELSDLKTRLAHLEARPPQVPVDLMPIDLRLKSLEDKPAVARTDIGPLVAQVAALEARKPVDLTPLDTRVTALDGKIDPLAKKLDGVAGQVTALQTQLASVESQAKQTASGLAAINDRAQRSGRLIAASTALAAGQQLGDIPGAPPAVARFAHTAPPTEASLRLTFDQAAEAAHAASQPAITDNQSFVDRMWTRAQQSVTVRQGERVLVGDPIAGVLAGSRQALDAGDLPGAVKALNGLSGPARAAMADWIGRAQSVLDARAALSEMAAR